MNMDSKSDLKVYDGEQFDKDLCKVVGEYGSHSFQFKKLGRLPEPRSVQKANSYQLIVCTV